MLLGERVHASARGFTDAGPDELGVALIARMVRLRSGRRAKGSSTPCARDRRRAVEAALWIESNASRRISLADGASKVGLGPAHFLRLFARVVGVTPHQYLIRTRLRNAARLLAAEDRSATEIGLEVGFADLSNFVRTFHRAAGLSPGAFRRAPRAARVAALQRLSSR
ncbi:MAG: AraC family transcriptional regulator [Myxococcota bacterium]